MPILRDFHPIYEVFSHFHSWSVINPIHSGTVRCPSLYIYMYTLWCWSCIFGLVHYTRPSHWLAWLGGCEFILPRFTPTMSHVCFAPRCNSRCPVCESVLMKTEKKNVDCFFNNVNVVKNETHRVYIYIYKNSSKPMIDRKEKARSCQWGCKCYKIKTLT